MGRKIECELALKCYTPSNGQYLKIEPWRYIPIEMERKYIYPQFKHKQIDQVKGHLIISKNENKFYDNSKDDVCELLNVTKHQVLFDLFCCFTPKHLLENKNNIKAALLWLFDSIKRNLCDEYKVSMKQDCIEIFQTE